MLRKINMSKLKFIHFVYMISLNRFKIHVDPRVFIRVAHTYTISKISIAVLTLSFTPRS